MSRPAQRRGECGFSVVEALVAGTLFLIIFLAVVATYVPNLALHNSGERRVDVQQNARLALSDMTRELRMAGYFPENFADPPADPELAVPLRVAGESVLAIYGATGGGNASTVSLYCIDGDVVRRTRGAVTSAASYTCNGGDVIAESAAGLSFAYFDENNIAVGGGAGFLLDDQGAGAVAEIDDTTERDSVRKVVITLTTAEDLPHGERQLFTLTSEARLRNRN